MVLSKIDEIEALQIGIQSKMDTYNSYKEALKNIIDKESKELLAILANQVKRQQERLKEKYSRLSGNRLLYLNLSEKPHYYTSISSSANDLNILQIAIEHEKKYLNFYDLASKKTLNAYGKAMLEELAKEDQRYFNLLQIEYIVRSKLKQNNSDKGF